MKPILIILSITLFTLTLFVSSIYSQDKGIGIFQDQDEYFQFMGSVKEAAKSDPELQSMIPLINDVVLGKEIGFTNNKYGGNQSEMGLLSNKKIREEIEMVDEQYENLQKMYSEVQKRAMSQFRDLDFTDSKEVLIKARKIREDSEKELEELLLPHQTKRLSQLFSQTKLQTQSLGQVITAAPLRKSLEISDEQAKEIRESEEEIEKELEEQIAELRKKARQKLLSKLNAKQRKEINELFGEDFAFAKNDEEKKNLGKSQKDDKRSFSKVKREKSK